MNKNIQPKTYYKNIKSVLIQAIDGAAFEIVAAVAWFTDDEVHAALIRAKNRTVPIKIMLQDDEINENSGLSYSDLEKHGIEVWFYQQRTDETMHLKSCLIDRQFFLTGSFNWTRKASKKNKESLTVLVTDQEGVDDFLTIFEELRESSCTRKFYKTPSAQTSQKSKTPFSGTQELTSHFLIQALRFQIKQLQLEISWLETDKNWLETLVADLERRLRAALSTELILFYELRNKLAELKANFTGKRADRFDAEQENTRYSAFTKQLLEDNARVPEPSVTPATEASLKQLYREAVKMAHPDLFRDDPQQEREANQIMAALTEAFRAKDISKLQEIHDALIKGIAFQSDWITTSDVQRLMALRDRLINSRDALAVVIGNLIESEAYILNESGKQFVEHCEEQKASLIHKIRNLKQEINAYNV